MKIYAMSDIHGYLQEFENALSKVDFEGDNILILLGDYIHGPDGYGVLDKIISLQNEYGKDKVIALLGNHEEAALQGEWPINETRNGSRYNRNPPNDEPYLEWMKTLPRYYVAGNAIFVHAGIDEEAAAEGYWEIGTMEHLYTQKYPAEIGKIENFDMKIIAGHISTHTIAGDPKFYDIYYDGYNHCYIDGMAEMGEVIPVLMYDTENDNLYRVTDGKCEPVPVYNKSNTPYGQ